MKRMIDMHTHTTASDGSYSPKNIIELAKKAGLSAIAITDHDTTDGLDEAINSGLFHNIEVIPGIEISVGGTDNMHILGFFINHNNPNMIDKLNYLKTTRDIRNKEMILKLNQQGFDISYEEIKDMTGSTNVGRLHIAQSIQKKGLINDYRKIFKKYIIKGESAYVPHVRLSEMEGIETILKAGGLPFLAHINYLNKDEIGTEQVVKRLKGYGLAGIEVFYSGYTKQDENLAITLAHKYGLLKSGGTDFHGTRRSGVYIGTGKGNMCVSYSLLEEIKRTMGY